MRVLRQKLGIVVRTGYTENKKHFLNADLADQADQSGFSYDRRRTYRPNNQSLL